MTDPRTSPRLERVEDGVRARISVPYVDLTRGPSGPRDRQLLFGDDVTVLDRTETHCRIRAEKDGYCGTVLASQIKAPQLATHRVTARSTHAYERADFKSKDRIALPFGARISSTGETATFVEMELGFVPRQHLHRADVLAEDPAAIATLFLGTPYLWGGNTHLGLDCSGLVQLACLACGVSCPGDSDQQEIALGAPLAETTPLERNDLIFWNGHVALVRDRSTLIHANAGHMMVVYEEIDAAIARIHEQGDGLPTSRKRLTLG